MIDTYITDIGNRAENEDSMYIPADNARPLYVIADGMGGHRAGETASRLAVLSLVDYVENYRKSSIREALSVGTSYANARVYAASQLSPDYEGMGTTLAAVYIENDKFYTANIGDSRVYLFSGANLWRVTEDHSFVAELVRSGNITEEEARVHPQRNVLTRTVGTKQHETAEIYITSWQPGDVILMCTDGLYDGASDSEIYDAIKNIPDLKAVCRELVHLSREGGSDDNVSVILIKYEEVVG